MAKKTKESAERTRLALIASARQIFLQHGVTHSTMEQIAKHAGFTRGAVHWHFANKVEIFRAMRDLVSIPMVDRLDDTLFNDPTVDALQAIENTIHELFYTLEQDEATRDTFMIIKLKCEYTGEFEFMKAETEKPRDECLSKMMCAFERAKQEGILIETISTAHCSQITQAFISGMMEHWLVDEEAVCTRAGVHQVIASFISTLRLKNP